MLCMRGSVVLVAVLWHIVATVIEVTVASNTYIMCTQAWHRECICPASCVAAYAGSAQV